LSVRSEKVQCRIYNGKIHHGKRVVTSITKFRLDRQLLKETVLTYNNKILYEYEYIYDVDGRLIKSVGTHDEFVYLPNREEYSYDSSGNLAATMGYDANGKLVNKNEYAYDEKNRRIRWTSASYHFEENSEPHQWTYKYDEFGRKTEELAFSDKGSGFAPTDSLGGPHKKIFFYNAQNKPEITLGFKVDGALAELESNRYDSRGNEMEDSKYDSSGQLKAKTKHTYRFDRFGNAIQENKYEWVSGNEKSSYQLTEIRYRIIRYYK